MASHLSKPTKTLIVSLLSRSFSSTPSSPLSRSLTILRPLSAAANNFISSSPTRLSTSRSFSTRPTSSSLNDPSPNWSNRPPKETILLDGCDFEHWLVVVEKPDEKLTRDEIIDHYIKTLATVVGSEEESRMKIYSVSTKHYFAFGALVSEELSYKLKEIPHVRWVLPDSYLDVKNKDYGGEPFINGQAVPYDPKYHEEWVRNNARANERNRRNDRPRNFDRSRNFERRRENMQYQDRSTTPMANQGMPNHQQVGGMQQNMGKPVGSPPPPPPNNYMGGPQNTMGGPLTTVGGPPPPNNYMGGPQNTVGGPPPPNHYMGGPQNTVGGPPPPNHYMGGPQNTVGGPPPPNHYMGGPQNNMGGSAGNGGYPPPPPSPPLNTYSGGIPHNTGGMPQNNMGGIPPNAGWSNNMPGNMQQNFQNGPNSGGMPNQGAPSSYQNTYTSNRDGSVPGGNPYST